MQREDLWATPVWYYDVPPTLINPNDIVREAYEHQNLDSGTTITNAGGYQSSSLTITNCALPTLSMLMGVIATQSQICSKAFGFDHGLIIDNFWININKDNHYNHVHVHPSCVLSGAYYAASKPQSGDIIFHNRPEASYISGMLKQSGAKSNMFNSTIFKHKPIVGRVVIFPGWLQHSVEENRSGEDRISIAFNIGRIQK